MKDSNKADILTFAVVGHPNEGKSSVVSTLTERDDIRVSATPGETEHPADYTVEVNRKPLLRFIDTPGFQVPRKTVKWLAGRPAREDAAKTAEAFAVSHRNRPAYAHDERILRAVGASHGVLYVVDGSKPIGPDDLAEMEILRLLGTTRMAVINSKGADADYSDEWRGALNRHFNSVRRFNARETAFDGRIRLLDALRLTEQRWEDDLDRVIDALRDDRKRRMNRAADIIGDLLREGMTKRIRTALGPDEEPDTARENLVSRFADEIRQSEERAHRALREEFRHHRFVMEMDADDIVTEDLFSKETWRVLGLTRRQLAAVTALAGAAAGAVVDVAFGEVTFGVFMVGGAVVGGVTGLAGSRPLSRVKIRAAGMNRRLGRRSLEIGPPRGVQLAFILIDRALLYLDTVSRWAHAKREDADVGEVVCSLPLTRQWTRKRQTLITRYVARLVRGKSTDREEEALREILQSLLADADRED